MSSSETNAGSPAAGSTGATSAGPAESAIEQGTYEILRGRLEASAKQLTEKANGLNGQRLELFGGTEMTVIGNERIRTEHNCVPRDIRGIGDLLLFGYNVFLGLKTETRMEDVLSLHRFVAEDGGYRFETVGEDDRQNFLTDRTFLRDFQELHNYYKDARLLQLRRVDGKLLAVFRTGANLTDFKVFRWAVDPDGRVTYIDNRGERDHVFPPSHDFEWTVTGRDQYVLGRHPHVNILDEVFVETVGGDLTVKVEDNTEDGLGIYREDVVEAQQSLDDAEIHYAKVGSLILLKILPYNETEWRYLVFNIRNQKVHRIDAIGQACLLLPEDHGLIFPGGYYLQNGETKSFEGDIEQMEFLKTVRSPNGEDVLYVFHERDSGHCILLSYNMIRKEVENPIYCHGFSFFDDGRLVIFRSTSDEPTRVHPMQIWQTPYMSDVVAAQAPSQGTFLEKVGNADLVRGISDALSICRAVGDQEPSTQTYEDLIAAVVRAQDSYYWLGHAEVGDLGVELKQILGTAELIVDEFAKVQAIRKRALEAVDEAEAQLDALFEDLRQQPRTAVDHFVDALSDLRHQRGHLITVRELRYVDLERVDGLEERIIERFDALSGQMVAFLEGDEALAPYHQKIDALIADVDEVQKVTEAVPISEGLDHVGSSLELLGDVLGSLSIDDATVRTAILEDISEVLGNLNRGRALLEARRKELVSAEGVAEFGAQFKLFSQSVSGALAMADTPEKCDEQLSKLMLQLEELESRFGELDQFIEQLATKREDVYEAFSSRKQTLMDERQRRAGRMLQAAKRILEGITRRASTLDSADALNTYFVGDAMVAKVRDLAEQLRGIQESVKADELESRLKAAKEDASRALRDRQEIFEDGANVIKFGRHRFSVNTQPFDLTLVPRSGDDGELVMAYHLTGTDFFQPVDDAAFASTRDFWDQLVVSETDTVYRSEYLAACMLFDAEEGKSGLSLDGLHAAVDEPDALLELVRTYSAERYEEGYERGLHDADTALILAQLVQLYRAAGLLRFTPRARSAAVLFWAFFDGTDARDQWQRRAASLTRLRATFRHSPAIAALSSELADAIAAFHETQHVELSADDARMAGQYLFEEIGGEGRGTASPKLVVSAEAKRLQGLFVDHLKNSGSHRDFQQDVQALDGDLGPQHALVDAWLGAFLEAAHHASDGLDGHREELLDLEPAHPEAVVLLLTEQRLQRTESDALAHVEVSGLLGQHPRIQKRTLNLRLDEMLGRLSRFRQERVPGFRRFQELRHRLLERQRDSLRLGEYKPQVMSAFVRNRLINEAYLPIIGDNLAKQMGALGDDKRTDQMGLLLLISPPGYGKTTLMEYIANRLGLVFVKVNGPALGHSVTSIDPQDAPNATARQEVEKINFALEMGNNVLLYLDDIQHTHPELLQKFISLCDAQRRIEGVWNGRTRTYDLKGKRFAVCMAGNPYTESGETFQIPDMLANRADTYNLGDILEGKDEVFALSYIENSLTSNKVLAPLTTREPQDIFKLVDMARDGVLRADQLSYGYSSVELEEILSVLRKMLRVQEVVLAINQQYILSAAQDDAFRTEPRFQLQGSYRNMNKLAEKVVPVMNDAELEALIDDHYVGEAQTLTRGAEHNLLKLAELRGNMTDEQKDRWEEIKRGFARVQAMGGSDDDPAVRMLGQLGLVSDRLGDIGRVIEKVQAASNEEQVIEKPAPREELGPHLDAASQRLDALLQKLVEVQKAPPAPAPVAVAPPAASPPVDLSPLLERLDATFSQLGTQLAEGVRAASPPPPPAGAVSSPPPAPQADLSPYLAQLGTALERLSEAPRGREVVQSLTPGVIGIFRRLTTAVSDSLIPAVQGYSRHMRAANVEDRGLTRQLDRTLRDLDQLKELVESLGKIDTRGLAE